ncbi:MAG TPA: hypothetical protein VEF06_12095 [Bryobacteraceae bacterium]|nr:hypothetical protein [Bryobacteraceae bacterium]
MKTTKILAVLLPGLLGLPVWANGPTYDSSGNGNLSGTYYFRQVIYLVDSSGDYIRGIALNGSLVFNGNGTYTIPAGATVYDLYQGSEQSEATPSALSGTYTLSQSGLGYMSSPVNGIYTSQNDTVYFTLGRGGILIGSSTEAGYNDMLIAAQQSSPAPSTGTFSGSWSMAGFLPAIYPPATAPNSEDVFFQMNPNGAGSLGTVTVTGYIGVNGSAQQTQTSANVKYTFSSGAAIITFPNASSATPYYSGQVILNFSADGNFVFGGMNGWFDMLVGVRNGSAGAAQNFGGLYFQGGFDQDLSQYSSAGFANDDSYYGSLNAANGVIFSHQRLLSPFNGTAIGSTFADQYAVPAVSPYNDKGAYMQFAYGSNGVYRIGAGTYPYLGLNVAVQAPALSGSGVWINPDGVVNAASSAPFTAGVSNGELVTLYGSNLASGTVVSPVVPLPTTLGGVQVLVNGTPAALYFVSQGEIDFIMPFSDPFTVAQIQVVNTLGSSNVVTEFINTTTPGVFTNPPGGIGFAAVVDNNTNQIVTPSNPANPGDTIEVFLTGLGTVYPALPSDGAAGPYPPNGSLATSVANISAEVGGVSASVVYAGYAPAEAALYQMDVTIPSNAAGGIEILEIDGPDSSAAQAAICVAGASCSGGSDRTPSDRAVRAMDVSKIVEQGHPLKHFPPAFNRLSK